MTLTATVDTLPSIDTNNYGIREQIVAPTKAKQALSVIDCDVHHQFDKTEVLYPYLPRHYVEWIKDFGSMMPGVGYTNMPGSGARVDLWDGKDINPATIPEVAIKDHLDKYGIDIAILIRRGPRLSSRQPRVKLV